MTKNSPVQVLVMPDGERLICVNSKLTTEQNELLKQAWKELDKGMCIGIEPKVINVQFK